MKKLASLLLALCLVMSLGVSALAADGIAPEDLKIGMHRRQQLRLRHRPHHRPGEGHGDPGRPRRERHLQVQRQRG